MRRAVLVVVILLIGATLLAIVGPEFEQLGIVAEIGTLIRNFVGGIAEWIGFSIRGFAPSG